MKRMVASWACASLLGACSAKAPPPPAEPTVAPPTESSASPASSADLPPAERCARGDLVVCGDLAWARARTIRPAEQQAGIRDLAALCERGLADACARSGDIAWGEDRVRARLLYERGCTLGSLLACASLGVSLDLETPGAPRAQQLLRKACDAGSPEGCTSLAETMRPKVWDEEALGAYWALMTRGCVGKQPRACRVLGLRASTGNGVPRDAVLAAGFLQTACEGRDGEGCTQWGVALQHGNGVPQDEKAAARAYGIGCDEGDPQGCFHLGSAYARGTGVAKDVPQAVSLFTRACRAGEPWSCGRLGRDPALEPDRARRLDTLAALCDEKVLAACESLGDTLIWVDPAEGPRAIAVLERACAARHAGACLSGYWAATALARKKKARGAVPLAQSFLERGCGVEKGHATCSVLAEQLASGEFVAKDVKRASELAMPLCEESSAACAVAGAAWERGVGVPRDPAKAARAYEKGCTASDPKACRELARLARSGIGTPRDAKRADELIQRATELEED